MNPADFEKIILKLLFTNKDVTKKILPFLRDSIFDLPNIKIIVKEILKFNEERNVFPTASDMKLLLIDKEVLDDFLTIITMDISEYDVDFLLEQVQEFFVYKLVHGENIEIALKLSDRKITEVLKHTEALREYLAFSFDTKIGLDLLEDGEATYDYFQSKDRVVSTGLPTVDEIFDGGWHEKTLSLFLAQTSLGKSLIMASQAANCLMENKNVLILSLEMSEQKYAHRIYANILDIEMNNIKDLEKNAFLAKIDNLKSSLKSKLIIKQYPPKSITTNNIKHILAELKGKIQFVPDIIFVDYLEIMKSCYATKNDNSFSELKKISEEVRGIAVEYAVPIISGVQINRGAFDSASIGLEDISQSIGVTYTADVIIGVTVPEEMKDKNKYVWTILKNRDGGSKGKKIIVNVDYPKMRVTDDEVSNKPQPSSAQQATSLVANSLKKDSDQIKKKITGWS